MPKSTEDPVRRTPAEVLSAAWATRAKARQEVFHDYQRRCRDAQLAWVSAQHEIRLAAWTQLQEAWHALVVASHTAGADVDAARRAYAQAQSDFQCSPALHDQFAQAWQACTQAQEEAGEACRKALAEVETDHLRAFKKGVAGIDPEAMEPATLCSLRLAVAALAPAERPAAPDKAPATA